VHELPQWAGTWDDVYLSLLASHKIVDFKKRGAVFAMVLPAIRTIRLMQHPITPLRDFFTDNPVGGLNVKEAPREFMKNYFEPVGRAMQLMWEWPRQKVSWVRCILDSLMCC
jgi:hypothetical protein